MEDIAADFLKQWPQIGVILAVATFALYFIRAITSEYKSLLDAYRNTQAELRTELNDLRATIERQKESIRNLEQRTEQLASSEAALKGKMLEYTQELNNISRTWERLSAANPNALDEVRSEQRTLFREMKSLAQDLEWVWKALFRVVPASGATDEEKRESLKESFRQF